MLFCVEIMKHMFSILWGGLLLSFCKIHIQNDLISLDFGMKYDPDVS